MAAGRPKPMVQKPPLVTIQLLGKLEVAATDHLVLTYIVYENSLIMSSFRYHVGHLAHKQRSLCRVDILLYYLFPVPAGGIPRRNLSTRGEHSCSARSG